MDRRTARRAFLKGCTASLTLAAVAACSPVVGVAGAGTGGLSPLPRERPNIVVIVSDDHGTDALGAYGNTYVQTPNLDALARDGTRFTSAFSTVSSCSPSRAAILSGKFVHANGMYGLSHLPYNFSSFPEITSFPKILSESGYRTALMGKFHVAPRTVYHFDRELATEDEVEAGLGRSPVEMAEGTRAFINEKDERPFLLYFAPTDPHRLGPYTLGESNHFGAKPGGYPGVTAIEYDPQKVTVPSFLPDLPETRQELAWYYQAVSRMDQGIGRLIAELKAAGKYDNTLILYLSDNGVAMPGAKTNLYDPGIRLPFIVKAPGARLGEPARSDALVRWVDIAPTVIDYAGMDATPYGFQGASIRPVMEGAVELPGRDAVFGSHVLHEIHMFYPMRMIRTHRYKLIQNFAWRQPYPTALDLVQSSTWQAALRDGVPLGKRTIAQYTNRPEFELYDLQADPDEVRNLADDPAYSGIRRDLVSRLHDFMRQTKDPFVIELGPIQSGS